MTNDPRKKELIQALVKRLNQDCLRDWRKQFDAVWREEQKTYLKLGMGQEKAFEHWTQKRMKQLQHELDQNDLEDSVYDQAHSYRK